MRWTHEILFPKVCLSAVVCHKRSHFSWRVFTLDFTWNWCRLLEAKKFSRNPGQFKWVAGETRHYISLAELLKWNLMGQVVELFRRPSIFQNSPVINFLMTGVATASYIDRGGIIWNRGGSYSKIINLGDHQGVSHRGTWTGCLNVLANVKNRWNIFRHIVFLVLLC